MDKLRIIKRYQNRKLYDTCQSSYVTLEEISQIIREGDDIKVIDNKTKEDITFITQIQILFDQERKSTAVKNPDLLRRVIRSSTGTFTGHIKNIEISKGLTTESDYQVDEPEIEIIESEVVVEAATQAQVTNFVSNISNDTLSTNSNF